MSLMTTTLVIGVSCDVRTCTTEHRLGEPHDGFRIGSPPSSYRSTDRIYEIELDSWDADDDDDLEGQQRVEPDGHFGWPGPRMCLNCLCTGYRPAPDAGQQASR